MLSYKLHLHTYLRAVLFYILGIVSLRLNLNQNIDI